MVGDGVGVRGRLPADLFIKWLPMDSVWLCFVSAFKDGKLMFRIAVFHSLEAKESASFSLSSRHLTFGFVER